MGLPGLEDELPATPPIRAPGNGLDLAYPGGR